MAGSRVVIKLLGSIKHGSLDTFGFEFHLNGGKIDVYISFLLPEEDLEDATFMMPNRYLL